ncbi:uncharacterized protein LOC131636057 [Vicia villosa]|uniref:uncharacterized protein LOC131636057 n=1 Tax=Vicia villosa TaxID=3911 RepID=UPI00273CC2A8|nr:uncharacterized protein LOC131636057 [Vicia villosa]
MKNFSIWWKDILALDSAVPENLFAQNCKIILGNGFETSFWNAWWTNEGILKSPFPSLFSCSLLRVVSVAAMGGWTSNGWKWSDFGIPQSVIEERRLQIPLSNMTSLLNNYSPKDEATGLRVSAAQLSDPLCFVTGSITSELGTAAADSTDAADSVSWMLESTGTYSVASCYRLLSTKYIPMGPVDKYEKATKLIWKMQVPMKVKAFVWRSFFNRLPTRVALQIRGLNSSTCCCFCGECDESIEHLFLDCVVASLVWKDMADWIGWKVDKCSSIKESFMRWHGYSKFKRVRKRKEGVLWMATCWNIWMVRNGIVFRNDKWNVDDIVWNAKITAWKWLAIGKISLPKCDFYNFSKDPLLFFS